MRGGASRWTRVWVGAVACTALLAGVGLWQRSPQPGAPPEPSTAQVPQLPPAEPASAKEQSAPRYRVERREAPSGVAVEVVRQDTEDAALAEFAEMAVVPLSPEEKALLAEAREDDFGALIARAERDFLHATPETREALERRYLLALNLSAKLAPVETPEPDARARAVQARYLEALAIEQEKWVGRSPDEQRHLQDAFKDDFFHKQGEWR